MKGSYAQLNKIRKTIERWQNGNFHPLTCGNDSQNHEILVLQLELDKKEFELFLVCKDCNWKQDIPDFFVNEVVEDDLN